MLESLAEDNPDDAAILNAYGYLLTDQFDRHEEARDYIERALALNPDSPAIIDSMGWVLYQLGDYRAARDYLESLGVASSRVRTVSYGKERPFCTDATEDCYQQNRRAHFVITAK